ncbi:hypothetical protein F3Y22_tig00113096pilonHSYRG00093 [Hibiscus syriacus]|uniref:Uncharacterized protein n=1 Tax=Hibiscus syriacus TaxID=106335 RepID=A0A6A2X3C8_HIBSY|nr:hypothetical protein F3Y22_tig00113096pilonHSYRG00093 [Hibiscus syriacus]
MDIEGKPLPTLVYLAREKRPQYYHNFKDGALNALGREIAYVQYPQSFDNLTENDIYGNCFRTGLEFAGFDGNGGPLYNGTGYLHIRETLCGMKLAVHLLQPRKEGIPRSRSENTTAIPSTTEEMS